MLMQQESFCFFKHFVSELLKGAAMFARSLPVKSIKRLALDVINTSATHIGLVHDVTDKNCPTQNGITHSSVSQLSNVNFSQTRL